MKRLAFIYNPKAGKGNMTAHIVDILNVFSKADYEVTMIQTQRKGHCKEYIASDAHRFDIVVVSGGDGTVNEAFNGLMCIDKDKRPCLGYIPAGTTNDFASSCTIPTDAYRAAEVIVGQGECEIDAGKFNDSYFSYVAAFGAFTFVAYDTPQQIKNIFGYAAYIIEGLKRINTVKPYMIKITTPQGVIEEEFIFGMVANSKSVGGMKIKSLNVDLGDGLFEVLLIKNIKKPADVNAVIADLMNKKTESEYYYVIKTDKITLSSEENIAWTLDGEYGGEHTQAEITNIQGAIKIKVDES